MEKEEAQDVQELLEHEEDTAGGLMTTEYLAFDSGMTVEEAITNCGSKRRTSKRSIISIR